MLSEGEQGPPEQLENITTAASKVSHEQQRSVTEMKKNKDKSLHRFWTVSHLQNAECGNSV